MSVDLHVRLDDDEEAAFAALHRRLRAAHPDRDWSRADVVRALIKSGERLKIGEAKR